MPLKDSEIPVCFCIRVTLTSELSQQLSPLCWGHVLQYPCFPPGHTKELFVMPSYLSDLKQSVRMTAQFKFADMWTQPWTIC